MMPPSCQSDVCFRYTYRMSYHARFLRFVCSSQYIQCMLFLLWYDIGQYAIVTVPHITWFRRRIRMSCASNYRPCHCSIGGGIITKTYNIYIAMVHFTSRPLTLPNRQIDPWKNSTMTVADMQTQQLFFWLREIFGIYKVREKGSLLGASYLLKLARQIVRSNIAEKGVNTLILSLNGPGDDPNDLRHNTRYCWNLISNSDTRLNANLPVGGRGCGCYAR